ncbi:MAG: helix-turn-helix domain-containing protein [Pseudomonadota bacterium]
MESFSESLKHWRAKRRMSQLDLAMEADVSARHISFLETGRARPSRDMVLHLSETLDVPFEARNRMLGSVGFAPRFGARDWDDAEMAPIRQAIDWTLSRHAPYPGVALNRLWVIERLNDPARRLFGALGAAEGVSMLDLIMSPSVQGAIENWPEVARHTVLRLRSESASQGGVPALEDAADRLSEGAGPQEAGAPAIPTIFILGTQRLALIGTIAQFATTADQTLEELRIELFFPADDAAAALLRAMAD